MNTTFKHWKVYIPLILLLFVRFLIKIVNKLPQINFSEACDTASGNYHQTGVYCLNKIQFEGITWYLVRRTDQNTAKWHPSTDDAAGSETYGTVFNNDSGTDTFSIQYDTIPWTYIMFAWGDFQEWIIVERSVFETFITTVCNTNCDISLFKTSEPNESP